MKKREQFEILVVGKSDFIELFTRINKLYEQKAPSVALVENHELLCDLRDSLKISISEYNCLENANRLAYDAYTRNH